MLLNAQNALLLIDNSVCKLSPKLTRISHINPKHTDEGLSKTSYLPPRERRFSNFSDLYYSDHHSPSHTPHDSPIIDYNQELSYSSPKEKFTSSGILERLDIDMIPDFPSSSITTDRIASCSNSVPIIPNQYTDRIASCPNSVQIAPNQYTDNNTNLQHLNEIHNHFYNEEENNIFTYNSINQYELPETMEDLSLFFLFLYFFIE